jgi:prephenate dehydratase
MDIVMIIVMKKIRNKKKINMRKISKRRVKEKRIQRTFTIDSYLCIID